MISNDNGFIASLSYYYELLTCRTVEVCNDRSRKITFHSVASRKNSFDTNMSIKSHPNLTPYQEQLLKTSAYIECSNY